MRQDRQVDTEIDTQTDKTMKYIEIDIFIYMCVLGGRVSS